ncbi:hypothetical protein AK830_g12545 [Neonectria ditissima]|uniref:CBF1-interacting co-repressor CIR N-terminal domain-containing protein n=1 Tax=Neonectria ditissima TaxID=78410 RepID=A0A0P7AK23_9HYPO|nr:hypothetical protein AK830_g12545 [Neonectria ditissima]
MPLHLLGKKSWNVYNADNIARVRRDEAAAKAAEEAEEQRMQEVDAQRRLAILRGEAPPPMQDIEPTDALEPSHPGVTISGGVRRKRKRTGEDDTDFELRVARENNEVAVTKLEPERKATSSAPIVDHAGHIDLFGDAKVRAHAEKNEEAEKDAKKKKQSFEDQYTMRFSNAAGRDGISRPWYSQSEPVAQDAPLKNVWGRDDPKRKDRDSQRIVASDPLAMMKQGASKIRELKKERKQFQEEQAGQLKDLRREQRHREKRRRGHDGAGRERERDGTSRHSDPRRRSTHRDQDQEFNQRSRRHDKDSSRDHRSRRYEHSHDRSGSKDKGRREARDGDERHRERHAQEDRERHRGHQPRHSSRE